MLKVVTYLHLTELVYRVLSLNYVMIFVNLSLLKLFKITGSNILLKCILEMKHHIGLH